MERRLGLVPRILISGSLIMGGVASVRFFTGEQVSSQQEIKPTSTLVLPKRPEPTPKMDVSAVQVLKVENYIANFGECPRPEKVGNLRVANPQIVGGVCPGK